MLILCPHSKEFKKDLSSFSVSSCGLVSLNNANRQSMTSGFAEEDRFFIIALDDSKYIRAIGFKLLLNKYSLCWILVEILN